jgi:endonuclease YncB( thermonuclease family)
LGRTITKVKTFMLRFILMTLLFPVLRKALPAIFRAVMSGVEQRRNSNDYAQSESRRGETDFDRESDAFDGPFKGRVRTVVDGDSLYVDGHQPQSRLWGVDAPEKHEAGYNQATQMLRDLTYDETLTVEPISVDKYGRTLARCYFRDDTELNYEMIKTGVVKEYVRFTKGYYNKNN